MNLSNIVDFNYTCRLMIRAVSVNRIAIFCCLFMFFVAPGLRAQDYDEAHVLFIGNSYTYFWNLPQTVGAMSEADSIRLITRQSTEGGVNLGQHWRSEKGLRTRKLINDNNYDYVVLQDHSMRAVRHPDSLMHYGTLLAQEIQSRGAKLFLYMTWAREWDPYMQEEINAWYTKLAEATGAELVPVGIAWDLCRQMRPDLALFDEDGSHPSAIGTYLTACVFYAILSGKSCIGLDERIISRDRNGEKLYLNIQSKETALFLQKTAMRSIDLIKQKDGK